MNVGKVVVGYCHPSDVSAFFHASLLDLFIYDVAHHQRILNGGGRIERHGSANISNARNGIVRAFLDGTQAEWLWMVDADMRFAPDTLDRLVDAAVDAQVHIVGGLCFGHEDGALWPTLYQLVREPDAEPRMVRYETFTPDTLMPVSATGAACLLIHRDVLEDMRGGPEPYPWFQETALAGQPCGEDVTFCLRAGMHGYPTHVHTGIQIGHAKTLLLTAEMYADQRARGSHGSDHAG